ncbi:MAG: hypothetical protein EHM28_01150 [Spirochaetaceae bacterium]|nr:MAG: hypothetical protein EHM28_01150 [Spirochaetaceae bacterium]
MLFSDDFSQFPAGPFPSNYFATQEYHYLPPVGFTGAWREGTISHSWRPCTAAWIIIEENGKKRMLSTIESTVPHPRMLVTGDCEWQNYTAKIELQFMRIDGSAGLLVRYRNNREYYVFLLENGNRAKLVRIYHEEQLLLGEAEIRIGNTGIHELSVTVSGNLIEAGFDGKKLFSCRDDMYNQGRVALFSTTTCFFDQITIQMPKQDHGIFINLHDKKEKELCKLREQYPKPLLWRKLSTQGFGAGRQLRFGHLQSKKNELDILIAQNIKLQPEKDDYSAIRCLTAVDLAGNVLWQIGEPQDSMDAAITTSDLPVQIFDIDGDGADEVICVKNFRLMILDGMTGKVKKSVSVPNNAEDENRYGFLNADCVIIANVRGLPGPQDIIIKNRYRQFWIYDDNLNLLMSAKRPAGKCKPNTGHFPMPFDANKDGRDEIFAGYTLFDADCNVIWNHDWPDHTDEIIMGHFNPDQTGLQIATVSGDEGFCIFDAGSGEVLHKELLGHAQRISSARFRQDLPGLQFYCITFWHHPGIISFHDCTGKRLFSFEPDCLGNTLNPVNWRGDGCDLALLNTSAGCGGMIDGNGRRVVLFPNDGHPDLCAEACDLTGDPRSEIVTWDKDSIWIYTQDRPAEISPVYNPKRAPHYNQSNYRGEYSFPRVPRPGSPNPGR